VSIAKRSNERKKHAGLCHLGMRGMAWEDGYLGRNLLVKFSFPFTF
jgi:hypothetical protein